ncbi:MAG TPA: hemerythrin family protein [Thermoanaerobaculia bacterium]|nr:hemerythrin family protein [Thermoanaerobaculia bacterium]
MANGLPDVLRLGVAEMDTEHLLQVQILSVMLEAFADDDWPRASDLIRQLQDVTEAHFVAEQLLMRLHAYPGYAVHEREHDQLIDELRSLEESIVSGDTGLPAAARSFELWLLHHIHTADKAFALFLLDRPSGSGTPVS